MSHRHHHQDVPGVMASLAEVATALAEPGRAFAITTHRKPDGDAAGSMIAMARILRRLGADVVMWHVEGPGLPDDLAWLLGPSEEVLGGDVIPGGAGRVLVSLDASTSHRVTDADPHELGASIINIDHHNDNPMWGDLNLVDGAASSTAEMVVRIADALGVGIDEEIALPLYVGIVTDTGRFSYASTGPGAHEAAARLVEAGVDPGAVFRRLYEGIPLGNLRLMGRALATARPELDGRLVVSVITDEDVREAGGEDSDGVVETLRSVAGARVAALIRQVPDDQWRVSVRSSGGAVDVSAIAALEGGGGHRAAAGFTSNRSPEEIISLLRDGILSQGG